MCNIKLIIIISYLFKFSQEVCRDFINEQQKILPPAHSNKKHFGCDVVLSNNYLMVGSRYDSENGLNAGAVHIYRNNDVEWTYHSKLIPSENREYSECGSALAADGNTLLVGCPRDPTNGPNSGSIFIFELKNTTWVETHTLRPSDGKPNAYFGKSMDIHKNTIVVNSNTDASSVAYIYKYKSGKWQKKQKLEYSTNTLEHIPYSNDVAIYGSHVVVGRWHDNKKGHQSGAVIVFQRMGGKWSLDAELRPHDGTQSDWFGMSVAIGDNIVVVSSHGDDIGGVDGSGSAYVFKQIGGMCFYP